MPAFPALDLFGDSHLPGLKQIDDIMTPSEEQVLIGMIDASGLSPFKYQQWTGKRLTQSFGWSYDFQTGIFAPTSPIPDWLISLKRRAAAFAGVRTEDLVQALLIRYEPGAGIGWHRDRPVFEHVVGISLGEPATMRFRKKIGSKFMRTNIALNPRAIYHLSGEMRHEWEHSIAEMQATRWSITFRSLRS